MKYYETRYKALVYLLSKEFDENGFRFSILSKNAQDEIIELMGDFILNENNEKEEYKIKYETFLKIKEDYDKERCFK